MFFITDLLQYASGEKLHYVIFRVAGGIGGFTFIYSNGVN